MRKQQIKKAVDSEKMKECTYRPNLYKSKVKAKKELNHMVYKKESTQPSKDMPTRKFRPSTTSKKAKPLFHQRAEAFISKNQHKEEKFEPTDFHD